MRPKHREARQGRVRPRCHRRRCRRRTPSARARRALLRRQARAPPPRRRGFSGEGSDGSTRRGRAGGSGAWRTFGLGAPREERVKTGSIFLQWRAAVTNPRQRVVPRPPAAAKRVCPSAEKFHQPASRPSRTFFGSFATLGMTQRRMSPANQAPKRAAAAASAQTTARRRERSRRAARGWGPCFAPSIRAAAWGLGKEGRKEGRKEGMRNRCRSGRASPMRRGARRGQRRARSHRADGAAAGSPGAGRRPARRKRSAWIELHRRVDPAILEGWESPTPRKQSSTKARSSTTSCLRFTQWADSSVSSSSGLGSHVSVRRN